MANIRSSFDIDSALEASHGFDQYGLDSLWRSHMGLPQLPNPNPDIEVVTSVPWNTGSIKPTPTTDKITSIVPNPTKTLSNVESINISDSNGCYAAPESSNDISTNGLIGIPILMSIYRKAKRKND